MPTGRAAALLVSLSAATHAATPAQWLNTPPAQDFRQRVIDLALIYNEGSGIDPEGFKIDTRVTAERMLGCAVVEVVISKAGVEIQRESVPACRH